MYFQPYWMILIYGEHWTITCSTKGVIKINIAYSTIQCRIIHWAGGATVQGPTTLGGTKRASMHAVFGQTLPHPFPKAHCTLKKRQNNYRSMHYAYPLDNQLSRCKTKLKKQQEKSITKLGKLDDLGFINIVAPTNMSESSATTTVDQSGDCACNELNSSIPEDMIPLALERGGGGGGGPFKITSPGDPVTLNPALPLVHNSQTVQMGSYVCELDLGIIFFACH